MGRHEATLLFASEKRAAGLLDMKPTEFRQLVASGALPRPVKIGDLDRWYVAELDAIASGNKPKPTEEFTL